MYVVVYCNHETGAAPQKLSELVSMGLSREQAICHRMPPPHFVIPPQGQVEPVSAPQGGD